MSRTVDLHDHYLNCGVPDEIAENLNEFFPEDHGVTYEEVLLQQASMYESFQERDMKNTCDDYIDDWSYLLEEEEGEPSAMSQEAIDEALARSLQELGEAFDDLHLSQHTDIANGSIENSIAAPASWNSREGNIDLDSMQYEELLNLSEAIGVENRGISETQISKLPTFKYRSGLFSKNKEKKENCVICQMDFNFGERLLMLPCLHQYHVKCISDWLKLKKNCPICQKEVVV